VLVVNEPALAEAIRRLRGEWAERSGCTLTASASTWAELVGEKSIGADLVVFPSRYLGELCVRGWLRPVRSNVLESEHLAAADFFPLVRHVLVSWGGQVMALPLGVELPYPGISMAERPALAFLAQAAPKAVSKERFGVLFDSETMRPRIAESPFVEVLVRLGDSKNSRAASLESTGGPLVPVLGYSDRLAAVTSSSRNAASAFRLLEWLALAETSAELARAGSGTMPVRQSLASSPAWYGPQFTASERIELGKVLQATLSQRECLLIPRVPGVDEYMVALDQAVRDALAGNLAPQAALETTARRWERITDAHGRIAQRRAYLKHLGVSKP
jgi:hypothetical protein